MNSQRISNVSRKEDSVALGKQMAVLLVEKDGEGDGKFHFHKLDQGFMQIAKSSFVELKLGIKNNIIIIKKPFQFPNLPMFCHQTSAFCCWLYLL